MLLMVCTDQRARSMGQGQQLLVPLYKYSISLYQTDYNSSVYTYLERTIFSEKSRRENTGKNKFTAFMLWAKNSRIQVEEQNPGIDFATTKIRLVEMWENLPDSDKYHWKQRAKRIYVKMTGTEQHMSPQIRGKLISVLLMRVRSGVTAELLNLRLLSFLT